MITRHSCLGRPCTSTCSASAPLIELTANQPTPATTALSPDGRMLPRKPKPVRLSTIWHSPSRGPQVESTACATEPASVPITIASTLCQNVSPK